MDHPSDGGSRINQEVLEAALRRLLSTGGGPPPSAGAGGQAMQQALLWAALGAAAAWVLSDPAVRDRLIRQALKLYGELAMGLDEVKSKAAEMKAEVDADIRNSR
ncbi:MAG: hypothetical protein QM522_04615 [Chitinophagaceae bacterium]|jgi:hypothetical protein|nr:hypothetical protein [Chitinophagaceae bacterium]